MRSLTTTLSIIVYSVLTAGAPAWAHITPDKAKAIKAELTQGYLQCTAPDTITAARPPGLRGAGGDRSRLRLRGRATASSRPRSARVTSRWRRR